MWPQGPLLQGYCYIKVQNELPFFALSGPSTFLSLPLLLYCFFFKSELLP